MHRTLAVLAALVAALASALPAAAGDWRPINPNSNKPVTLAVIGDTPYGDAQVAAFPALIAALNAAPDVAFSIHVGDIKNGSSLCTDAYFATIKANFDDLADPLAYTPGDNEWTDCHRPNNGGFLPTERLAALRSLFYASPRVLLGGREKAVLTQADEPGFSGYPENQLWLQSRVAFATVHVVGSNDNLAPWTAETPAQTVLRLAENAGRRAASLAWIDEAFDTAEANDARGVVLAMQADTWTGGAVTGFNEIVGRIAARAAAFEKPVLLFQGDTHRYLVDTPLVSGSPRHGVTTAAPNLTRVVVEGETASEWLRLTVDPRTPGIFTWERVNL